MSRVYDNSYLGKGVLSAGIASMSYNVGRFDNVAYQVHVISRLAPVPDVVISSPNAQWTLFEPDGTPKAQGLITVQEIPPVPEEREAEQDAGKVVGPVIGNIKLQQSNDNIVFTDVPTYTSNIADNGDVIFSVTNPLTSWHRLWMVLQPGEFGFTVRVCARINTAQSE